MNYEIDTVKEYVIVGGSQFINGHTNESVPISYYYYFNKNGILLRALVKMGSTQLMHQYTEYDYDNYQIVFKQYNATGDTVMQHSVTKFNKNRQELWVGHYDKQAFIKAYEYVYDKQYRPISFVRYNYNI